MSEGDPLKILASKIIKENAIDSHYAFRDQVAETIKLARKRRGMDYHEAQIFTATFMLGFTGTPYADLAAYVCAEIYDMLEDECDV